MSDHFLAGLLCCVHLTGWATTGEHSSLSPKTLPNSLPLMVRTVNPTYSLTKLPTSAPQTPRAETECCKRTFNPSLSHITEERTKLRRTQTECNLQNREESPEYQEMASFIKQMMYLKVLEKKAKQAEEKKHQEWLAYVKASNNSGYFPGYTGSDPLFCNSSTNYSSSSNVFSNQEEYTFQGSHMNF